MKTDIVYILGTGSRWQDNELRYSLRSLAQHFPHRKVFVVGERPKWLKNITHIPAADPYPHKLRNAIHKIRIAALDKRVSERFVLMNDDFFFLNPTKTLPLYYKGWLSETTALHPKKSGYYFEAIYTTRSLLHALNVPNPLDYSVHYPITLEKKKVVELTDMLGNKHGYLFRTVYCNLNRLGGTRHSDMKLKRIKDLDHAEKLDVVSTTPDIVLTHRFREWIAAKFPEPSRYEKKL